MMSHQALLEAGARLLSAHIRRMWPGTTVTAAADMHECDSVLCSCAEQLLITLTKRQNLDG